MSKTVHTCNEEGRCCVQCLKFKLWEEFPPDKRGHSGRKSRCRECQKINTRAYTTLTSTI